jgi:exopolyphosphatase/guanosine-5'-triphosphate,3'-diphosphate pyrophosphatase
MCVFDYHNDEITTVFSTKENLGLAGQVTDGVLPSESIQNVCEVLKHFHTLALKFVSENDVHAFTTAIFRKIDNKEEAMEQIKLDPGITPEHLSGKEEARLSFVGVKHATGRQSGFMLDVGGASTELVSFADGEIERVTSTTVGCLELFSKHVRTLVVTDQIKKSIKAEIDKAFNKFDLAKLKSVTLIGVGVTARTALKMSKAMFGTDKEDYSFPTEHLRNIRKGLQKHSPEVYRTLYRVSPDRIVTFFPGLLIIEEAVKRLRSKEFYVSKYGVREGYYIDRILKLDTISNVSNKATESTP